MSVCKRQPNELSIFIGEARHRVDDLIVDRRLVGQLIFDHIVQTPQHEDMSDGC